MKQDWIGVKSEKADITALKSLAAGNANEEQQKRALEFIIKRIAGEPSISFHPDSDRITAFLEGRRFVGRQIIQFVVDPLPKGGK